MDYSELLTQLNVVASAAYFQQQNNPTPQVSTPISGSIEPPFYPAVLKEPINENALDKYQFIIVCRCFQKDDENTSWDKINACMTRIVRQFKDRVILLLFEDKKDRSPSLEKVLQSAFRRHFNRKKNKPGQKTFIIVLTDALPQGKEDLEKLIVHYANKLKSKDLKRYPASQKSVQLALAFFQVGHNNTSQKELKALKNDVASNIPEDMSLLIGNMNDLSTHPKLVQSITKTITSN